MFERFTERARQVVVLAQDEARTLKHDYIGTEHILLGLLREEDGLAARVLETLHVTEEEVRAQVARIVAQGDEVVTGQIAFTPRARNVLELALRESLSLGHDYIATEHILLGLVRENEGVAARILLEFDADAETIRNEVIGRLPPPSRRGPDRIRQVVIACPACGQGLETVIRERSGSNLDVSAEGDRTCHNCGKRWSIAYTVSLRELSG
ncbi:MAG TPA: Clp protease N-terminal domain-containing protein [Gaiellales bacterium]|nr:Clp protease N-terminal domain-containing protein [Gaiellales bacterium]